MRKNEEFWFAIGAFALLALFVAAAYLIIVPRAPSPMFGSQLATGGSGGATNAQEAQYASSPSSAPQTDLSALIAPYLAATDFQASCGAYGGNFVNSQANVGCYNTVTALDVSSLCNSAMVLAGNAQCQAVGASPVCDAHNIGCAY